ncbi:hypothetical protein CLV59_104151 [Chitinophaga dinghuensis]|uniref:YdhG-like domain-containing protein n=1 Tax=Chitinophaga dinghuensis TaxID=1539050 RepID=A0A327W109_9BACT|nr:DUF1801 domain-containing protein [Chitinophaga dinghuensis]RAJ81926.1 hypothetical protein CLV59_104151 [Chitinophaga dinghuensis]
MTDKHKFTDPSTYLAHLEHPLKEVVEALRTILLKASPEIGEQIKWNSLSFYFTGEMPAFDAKTYQRDMVVFNVHKKEYILLVFPNGASITDTSGLLEGAYADGRRMIKFASIKEVDAHKADLQQIVKNWLKQVIKT